MQKSLSFICLLEVHSFDTQNIESVQKASDVGVMSSKPIFNTNHIVIFPLYKSPTEKACNYFLNHILT